MCKFLTKYGERYFLAIGITAALILIPLTSVAQPERPQGGPNMERPPRGDGPFMRGGGKGEFHGFLNQLDLSEEQREELKTLRKGRGEVRDGRQEIMAVRAELRDLMIGDSASDEQIRSKAKELNTLMAEQNLKRIDRMLELRKILTPEQRKKLQELMDEKRGEFMKRRGQFGGPPDDLH